MIKADLEKAFAEFRKTYNEVNELSDDNPIKAELLDALRRGLEHLMENLRTSPSPQL
jgi:hypothetical protein